MSGKIINGYSIAFALCAILMTFCTQTSAQKLRGIHEFDSKKFSWVDFREDTISDFSSMGEFEHLDTMQYPPSFIFYDFGLKGENSLVNFHADLGTVSMSNVYVDTLTIAVGFYHATLSNVVSKQIEFRAGVRDVSLYNGAIGEFFMYGNSYSNIFIYSTDFKKIDLRSFQCDGEIEFLDYGLPDTLILYQLNLSQIKRKVNLGGYKKTDKVCYLGIYDTDPNMLDLVYNENFKLYFPSFLNLSIDKKIATYQSVLNSFKEKGQFTSYANLDREFKEFQYTNEARWVGYVVNWIDKQWWDYGYDKFLVIRNAVWLNVFFFLINLFIFGKLVNHGYNLQKFVRVNAEINDKYQNRFKRTLAKSPYIFLYTSYIFWGLKLDINNLGIHRIGLFLYVLLQYIAGIVCLAYIANLIITV